MHDDKVIDELGGGAAIAEALAALGHEVTPDQVYMWKSRDRIPPEWRPAVAQIAAEKIKRFDREKFLTTFRRRKPRAPKVAA